MSSSAAFASAFPRPFAMRMIVMWDQAVKGGHSPAFRIMRQPSMTRHRLDELRPRHTQVLAEPIILPKKLVLCVVRALRFISVRTESRTEILSILRGLGRVGRFAPAVARLFVSVLCLLECDSDVAVKREPSQGKHLLDVVLGGGFGRLGLGCLWRGRRS